MREANSFAQADENIDYVISNYLNIFAEKMNKAGMKPTPISKMCLDCKDKTKVKEEEKKEESEVIIKKLEDIKISEEDLEKELLIAFKK